MWLESHRNFEILGMKRTVCRKSGATAACFTSKKGWCIVCPDSTGFQGFGREKKDEFSTDGGYENARSMNHATDGEKGKFFTQCASKAFSQDATSKQWKLKEEFRCHDMNPNARLRKKKGGVISLYPLGTKWTHGWNAYLAMF